VSKRNDISQQIHKYLNGELDARAMHQLEQEAQNDPFLLEALEGYEISNSEQQKNIDEINSRLQARINKKERRIIPWRIISIAASILIILSVGGLFIKNYRPNVEQKTVAHIDNLKSAPPVTMKTEPSKELATINTAPPPTATIKAPRAVSITAIAQNPKAVAMGNPPSAADVALNPPPKLDAIFKDTTKLAEVNVVGYSTQRKVDIMGSVQSIPSVAFDKKSLTVANGLEGKVAGINIYKAKDKAITGIVKDESGQPIPGASIRIKGSAIGTQTNLSGYFKLDSVPNKSTLSVDFIGYNKKEVAVTKRDSLVIAMQPSDQSLNEVVVVGYGTRKEQEYQRAQPAAGWDDYKKYLKDNAISPDGKTGTVKLSFVVNTDNSLSDFKIIKSVSATTDSAAIALVTNGPDWQKSNTGKAEKVKLRIKFTGK
jgi:CarboxypepD_reg-like domain